MPDRDFEKQVQMKMDELRLRPSDAVWAGVERDLRRGKRRRRAVLWLPLLGLLLATGGYFVFTGVKQSGQSPLANRENHIPATQGSDNTSTTKDNNNNNGQHQQPENTASDQPDRANHNTTSQQNRQSNNNTGKKPVPVQPDKSNTGQAHNTTIEQNDNGSRTVIRNAAEKTTTGKKVITVEPDDNTPAKNSQTITAIEPSTDPDINEEKLLSASAVAGIRAYSMPLVTANMDMKPSPAVAARKAKQPSQWQWGVQAHAGVTNMAEGSLFNLLKAARVDDLSFNDAGLGLPTIGLNGFGAPPPQAEPSPLEAGPSASLGFYVKRQVSKRISLSAGLQYSYFSLHTTVGARVDSLVTVNVGANNSQFTNQYYRSNTNTADTREYTNRYHFVELPVTVSIQLNNSRRLPITWDAGIAASYLLHTNALHYDGVTGRYYNNNDLFNKTQLLISSGFNVGLFQQRKHPVFIGPGIKYYATRLVDRKVSDGQHLWSAGFNMRMLLKK